MTVSTKIEEAGFVPASRIAAIGVSKILQIGARAAAMKKEGLPVIILGAGEPDFDTPDNVKAAAKAAIDKGDTKYTALDGTPELKKAISEKFRRENNVDYAIDEVTVATGAKQILFNAFMATINPGDEVIIPTPYWTSYSDIVEICGGVPVLIPCDAEAGFRLKAEQLEAAITPKTRVLFVNTPSNPTGWTATREDLASLLAIARRHGLWIMADEIYALYHYAGGRAPSFLDVMEEGDRIVFVNSFSKNWSMTGWRVGWIVAPPEMGQVLENLIQYSTSGVPQFLQQGAIVALDEGDAFVQSNIDKAARNRDVFCDALIATNRVETLKPDGALYAFLKIDGVTDSRSAALDIVDRTNVGLAPGTAFGPGGALFMRACFLRDPAQVAEAADRLARYIAAR